MKKLFLLLCVMVSSLVLTAQNPDDLVISGYVTNSNGLAIANHQVCVTSDSLNPNPFYQCVYTNPNGWYTITVTNGSLTGSNQTYKVFITDCNNTYLHQLVSNNQGTVNSATVNFIYCQQTTTCDASFTHQVNGLTVSFTSNNTNTTAQHLWNFGNGMSSTQANPTVNFPTAGTYTVCHKIHTTNCNDSVCVVITIGTTTNCSAAFTYQTSGLTVTLTPTMANTLATYTWSFGNGSSSTQYNATHTYATAGTYTVCLHVTSGNCTDSTCQTIVVGNTTNCLVSYSYSTVNLPPNQVQFHGILGSGTGAYNWLWHFGDGTTGQGQNPLHTYSQPGHYSVCVHLTQNSGTILCSYCDSIYVPPVNPPCQAHFTYIQSGTSISFNSGTSQLPSSPVLYNWNFGNGATSTQANPVFTYTTNGTYNVCLTITSTNSNCTDTYCQTITVGQSNVCNISFTFAQNPNGAYVFTPTFPTTISNPQFHWNFGDGQTSTLQNPVHAYVNAGVYSVCLTISGSGITCTYCDSAYFNSTVNACNASFIYQTSGLTVTFSSPMVNTLANHYWSFGNGTSSTLANPTVTYTAPGTYNVCHHVWNNNCSDSICMTITVGQTTNCIVSYTYSTQNVLPGQVQFFGHIQPATGTYYWHWSFGDGQSANGQQNPIHQYAQPGHYVVCVNVMQNNGTIACSYCDSIYVPQTPSIPCNANFTFQQSGTTVHFFHNNSGISPSTTMNYYWDFGDNTSSNLVNPTHTYLAAGVYNVCLTITDSLNNCSAQYCVTITIGNNTTCQASFQFTYGSIYNAAFFGHFTPLSTALQWVWDFGDGTTGTGKNITHSFPGPGTYNVCLTVITPAGTCPSTTYCQTVVIQGNTPNCQAYFTYQVNNANVHFNGLNSSSTPNQFLHYVWDFGDSTTGIGQNIVHTYTAMGTYTVCLTVIDSINGCSDQFCQTIILANNIQLSGQILCGNNPADAGTVYLLSVIPGSSNGVVPVAQTTILAGGYYQFSNVPYGNYLIQAHLSPNSTYYFNYLPTYYGDVLYWSQAIFVSIGQVNLTVQYDINMIGTNLSNSGNGQLSGNVYLGTGNKTTVSDVLVILLDALNQPVTYTYSDALGYFEFNNLDMGTYQVFAEIWGKDPIAATVVLNDANPVVDNVVITINDETVIASLKGNATAYFDFVNHPYPNPTQANINIELSLKLNSTLSINIYNILGVSVYSETGTFSTGIHRLQLNTSDLPAGLYYIDIIADHKNRISKMFNKMK